MYESGIPFGVGVCIFMFVSRAPAHVCIFNDFHPNVFFLRSPFLPRLESVKRQIASQIST